MQSIELCRSIALLLLAACSAAAQTAPPSGYVGSETCQACHQEIYDAFQKTPHEAIGTGKRGDFRGIACESCHGPAQKHIDNPSADTIRNPGKIPAEAADKVCLTCHLNQPTQAGRLLSSHMRDQVACTSCHKVHANGGHSLVARKSGAINEQCASCHLTVWAEFQRPNHHKLPEGAMSCVDCHNPHGSTRAAMAQLFAGNESGCFACHGDLRGPYTFEHAPVRFEGCSSCHEPHGSANPRMLTRQDVRFVCLECHANLPSPVNTNSALGVVPPSFHNLLSPVYQNCTVCHQKVHGSYVDRNLLK